MFNNWLYPFSAFVNASPSVPAVYWDVRTEEERYARLCHELGKVIAYADAMGADVKELTALYDELRAEFDKFKESGFEDYYAQQIAAWVEKNMPTIIEQAIKFVFFGLTDDGYFCAYIPKSWTGIQFDTIMDYTSENYGSLVLKY